jgi:hypothetical protein
MLAKQAFYHFGIYFALVIFGDGVLQTICPGWPQTVILPEPPK